MNTVDYHAIRGVLRSGDIIAFWGSGPISTGIRARTMWDWPWWGANPSHVGVVLDVKEGKKGRWRVNVVESTSLDNVDPETGEVTPFSGVVVNRLSERLGTYDGTVAVARVFNGLGDERTRARVEGLRHVGKQYDLGGALAAGLWLARAADDDGKIFCSELGARMHIAAGWLARGTNPDEVTPKGLLRGPYLTKPQRLVYP